MSLTTTIIALLLGVFIPLALAGLVAIAFWH